MFKEFTQYAEVIESSTQTIYYKLSAFIQLQLFSLQERSQAAELDYPAVKSGRFTPTMYIELVYKLSMWSRGFVERIRRKLNKRPHPWSRVLYKSRSVSQKIPLLFCVPKVHLPCSRETATAPVHVPHKFHFSIILSSSLCPSSRLFPLGFPTRML
jgi:hypothetical protein